MQVKITHGGKKLFSKTVNLTPNSNGCSVTFAGTVCSLDFSVVPGSGYVATLTAYNGLKGTGRVLSTGQKMGFKVDAGKVNTLTLTLDGVPAQLIVQQADGTSIQVAALDASGDFIAGPGAPSFRASKTSGATIVTITPSSTGNTIGFGLVASPPGGASTETIGVTATYPAGSGNPCSAPGAACTVSTAATIAYTAQVFFVADYGNSAVKGFAVPFSGLTEGPELTLTSNDPYAAGVDTNGNVFAVAYATNGDLYEYSPPYTAAAVTTASMTDDTYGELAFNSEHDAFVQYPGGNVVEEFAPPYTGSPTPITSGVSSPYGVAVDAGDNLYIGNEGNNTLGVFAKGAYTTEKYTVTLGDSPYSTTRIGSRLYVGESSQIEIFALPITSSAATPLVTISNGIDVVYGAALDSAGDLFVSNYSGKNVTEYPAPLTNGEAPSVTLSNGLTNPCGGLSIDATGNLYVIDYSKGQVVEFAPPFHSSSTPAAATAAMSDPCYGGLVNNRSFTLSVP